MGGFLRGGRPLFQPMSKTYVDRLNRTLADAFGIAPNGEPKFKWAHTRDVLFPLVTDGRVEMVRQMDEDYWTIAAWEQPTPAEWLALFESKVPYPSNGVHYVSDVRLPDGVEPTEAATQEVLRCLRYKTERVRTLRDAIGHVDGIVEAGEKRQDELVSDFVGNALCWETWVPGPSGVFVPPGTQIAPSPEPATAQKETT